MERAEPRELFVLMDIQVSGFVGSRLLGFRELVFGDWLEDSRFRIWVLGFVFFVVSFENQG